MLNCFIGFNSLANILDMSEKPAHEKICDFTACQCKAWNAQRCSWIFFCKGCTLYLKCSEMKHLFMVHIVLYLKNYKYLSTNLTKFILHKRRHVVPLIIISDGMNTSEHVSTAVVLLVNWQYCTLTPRVKMDILGEWTFTRFQLTILPLVPPICVSESSQHWFR